MRAWRVALPAYASTRILPTTNIAGINRSGPTAPNEQGVVIGLIRKF